MKIHQIIAFIFGLAFMLFAYWQLNDPDPWLWIPLYLLPAGISFAFFRGKAYKPMLLVFALIYAIGAVIYYPSHYEGLGLENLSMKTEQVEFARESFGLGICALVMLYYWFVYRVK